jgi:hypothetical protein
MSSRYERRKIPPDQVEGFSRWARDYYIGALHEAKFIVALSGSEPSDWLIAAVFDKLASPLVFLKDEWFSLDEETLVRYCPHLKKRLEEARAQAAEAAKKLG